MEATVRFNVFPAHLAVPHLDRRRPFRPAISSPLRPPTNPNLSLSDSHFSPSYPHFSASNSALHGASHFAGKLQPALSRYSDGWEVLENVPVVTAVLLGWMGAEEKLLRRYAELLYGARGFRTVAFTVRPEELLGEFDLVGKVDERVARLAKELVGWLDLEVEGGCERGLLIHSFSVAGCLVYGSLLEKFQERGDYSRRIRGCVVDSGGDVVNPQVWAAGFTVALLKQRSSLTQSKSADKFSLNEKHEAKVPMIELFILSVLKILFAMAFKLPYAHR